MLDYAPFFPADAEQILQASKRSRIIERMRNQHLQKAQNAVSHSTERRRRRGDVRVTKVGLSTRVTSAQKLETLMAMVFPLNPSEGFPISPTLRGNTRLTFNLFCSALIRRNTT